MTKPDSPPAIGWVCLPCRLALAALFIFAGILKLQSPSQFAEALMGFKIVPDHLVNFLVFATPWTEIAAGVLLFVGLWSRAAALVLVGTLGIFVVGIASVVARGIDTKCSCFGDLEIGCTGAVGWCQIIRNTILMGLGAVVIRWGPGPFAFDKASKA